MSRPESASDLACGCLFWGALALGVVVVKVLFWRAFIQWAVR